MATMNAAVFERSGRIVLQEKRIPAVGPTDALIRITTTTICGTDVHILKGEYPVVPGLTIGHEPVGVIEKLGAAVTGYTEGQRVLAGAITPCGQCHSCLGGHHSQCKGKAMGGWRFGNTIDGCQAEYVSCRTQRTSRDGLRKVKPRRRHAHEAIVEQAPDTIIFSDRTARSRLESRRRSHLRTYGAPEVLGAEPRRRLSRSQLRKAPLAGVR